MNRLQVFLAALALLCCGVSANAQVLNPVTPLVGGSAVASGNPLPTNCVTGCSTASPLPPSATGTAASSLVLKSSAGSLYTVQLTAGATAGYLMIFDATSAPADGTVTPKFCFGQIPANGSASYSWAGAPASFLTGITIVYSSTGCFTKTASATAFISGEVQ